MLNLADHLLGDVMQMQCVHMQLHKHDATTDMHRRWPWLPVMGHPGCSTAGATVRMRGVGPSAGGLNNICRCCPSPGWSPGGWQESQQFTETAGRCSHCRKSSLSQHNNTSAVYMYVHSHCIRPPEPASVQRGASMPSSLLYMTFDTPPDPAAPDALQDRQFCLPTTRALSGCWQSSSKAVPQKVIKYAHDTQRYISAKHKQRTNPLQTSTGHEITGAWTVILLLLLLMSAGCCWVDLMCPWQFRQYSRGTALLLVVEGERICLGLLLLHVLCDDKGQGGCTLMVRALQS